MSDERDTLPRRIAAAVEDRLAVAYGGPFGETVHSAILAGVTAALAQNTALDLWARAQALVTQAEEMIADAQALQAACHDWDPNFSAAGMVNEAEERVGFAYCLLQDAANCFAGPAGIEGEEGAPEEGDPHAGPGG